MKPERTLYDILEVSQRASPLVLKAAYRSLAQCLHPDKNRGALACGERLAEINAAYAVVSDPARRLRYDRTLGLAAPRTERRGVVVGAGAAGSAPIGAGSKVTRPFGFRPL